MTIGIIRILSKGRRNASIVQSIRTSKYRKQITFGIALAWGVGGYQLYKVAEKAKEDGTIDSPVLSKTDNPLKLEDSKHYRDLTIPEVILKSLGFGRDWMTELDPERRLKIHKWPWVEWWRLNVLPSETRYMVHENTTKYLQHEYYVSEICPDCYRVALYGSTFILFTKRVLYGYLSLKAKFFGFIVVASCLVGLVCGQSGGAEFASGNDQMAHRNNEDMLNNIYSITQRRMNLEVFKFNMWGLPRNAILHEKKRAEQTLSQRVIPIAQIDDYVRKASREDLRAAGVDKDKWAFGEPFPEAVQIRITSECLDYRGQPTDVSTKFVPPEKTEDMDEMDHFMMKLSKKLENSEPVQKYSSFINMLRSELEMPRKRKIIISSDEDDEVIPARQQKKSTNDNVGYVTRGLLGQLDRDVSQISTVIVSDEEKENIPKPLFQKASAVDEFESSEEFAPVCASTQKDLPKTPSTMPNVDKRIRKLENDLASSDEEQPIKKSSSKKNKLEKRRQKKMTLSSSDEETTDDKNHKNKTLEKDRLPKPDISQPKKKTDKELEKQNLSEEDLSHNTPDELPRPKQSQLKSPLDTSVSNRLYVEDCASPVCTKDRKFMQTPIRVLHKSSPIVRFVNNEERPKGRYYPKVETGSPPKPRKPNPVDEGDGVSVAPLARVKWCPPRPIKRGERGDSIITSNIEYQRSPGQGLRKVSGRQIVRFVQKEKINSEVILSNATVTDNPKEADTEN